ncbi:hypothetical protein [Bradyrhizobium sp.]|uniref:hypothetical protein n=1 Tax=Bradyrhizobium sp. TaxID=376 RepID=UPI0026267B77|nr:hypothetical protein [Bradyrhizobium sp.]
MNFKCAALASTVAALVSGGSASALTYDLTLNNFSGQTVGTGMFTVNNPIPGSGPSTFSAGAGLTGLSFSIDGHNFSLGNEQFFNPYVTFNNGALTGIAYLGSLNGFQLDLGTFNRNYEFLNLANFSGSAGTISDHVSTTPLPSGLPLFLTGLAALALFGWKKKRSMQAA